MNQQKLVEAVTLYESFSENVNGEKQYFVEGKWMESEVVNRNGRMYQKTDFEREVNRINSEIIPFRKALGETDHSDNPGASISRTSHIFEQPVYMVDNFICGKARILETPNGKIMKVFIDENIPFNVSSKGMGELIPMEDDSGKGYYLVENFQCTTIGDFVLNPSAINVEVKPVYESMVIDMIIENDDRVKDIFDAKLIEEVKKNIKGCNSKQLDREILRQYNKLMEQLNKK